jgi:hypothetical protein
MTGTMNCGRYSTVRSRTSATGPELRAGRSGWWLESVGEQGIAAQLREQAKQAHPPGRQQWDLVVAEGPRDNQRLYVLKTPYRTRPTKHTGLIEAQQRA